MSTILAVAGILASSLFGVLASVPNRPRGWVIGGAIVVGLLALLWLAVTSVPKTYDWWKRSQIRRERQLHRLRRADQEKSPSAIQDGQYGFEVIFATQGLKELDPDPNKWARVKRTRGHATYIEHGYPLEVHKQLGKVYLVGYASDAASGIITTGQSGSIELWMKPRSEARNVIEVPLDRISSEGSRGDGTRQNPWFLQLSLDSLHSAG